MSSLLESLLSQAAHIGADTKVQIEEAESILKRSRDRATEAKSLLNEREIAAGGFSAPRFMGLASVASIHGGAFNAQSQDSTDAARAMAQAFMASYTGRTDKSLAGGALANLARVISTGKNASALRTMLQSRLDHWQSVLDSAPDGESASDRAARIAEAKRYLTPCGDAPMENGDWPQDTKTGKPRQPKFNGRPATTIRGVSIPFGRGTNRDSQIAAFADLYAQYGDKVLSSDVVDAFLDNGGRYKVDSEASLADACNAALVALDQMMAAGGKGTGDEAFLMAAHAVISRIHGEGFKGAQIAAPTTIASEPETPAEPESIQSDAALDGDVDALLAGVGGEDVPAGGEAPAEAAEAPGVALGEAAPEAGGSRRKRARAAKGV